MIKKILCVLFMFFLAILMCACRDGTQSLVPEGGDDYRPPINNDTETTTQEGSALVKVDTSWQQNYSLQYAFLYSGELSLVSEMRAGNQYKAVDEGKGFINYYIGGENGVIDNYRLYPDTKEGTHKTENSSINTLKSQFMSISNVQSNFTSMSNVLFEDDDTVAGRPAKRYRQTQLDDEGAISGYALVWIDNEFGFAIKGQICLADDSTVMGWEVVSFETGRFTEEDFGINLAEYTLTESVF